MVVPYPLPLLIVREAVGKVKKFVRNPLWFFTQTHVINDGGLRPSDALLVLPIYGSCPWHRFMAQHTVCDALPPRWGADEAHRGDTIVLDAMVFDVQIRPWA